MDLTDLYTTLYPTAKEYAFYSAECGSFSKIDHMLKHKINISKYRILK